MDSRLYDHILPNHRIFKDLRGNLKENPSGKLRSLLELKDDVLFIWNPEENCLWCLNLKQLEENGDETPYQKLHFLSPPSFTVERLMTSPCGSRVCVWGSRGVVIAVLPARWARAGLFDGAGQTVLCKSHSLDERFLFSQGEVRRVHWHPSSLSHVLVLVSDNTIRLYNIALKSGPKLVRFFTIGPKPSSMISGRTLLESLGDTAVDFTPLPDTDTLLILRGNGDVYMLDCELDPQSGARALRGPLAVSPPADDNYGSESCALAALGARAAAPLLVLATASAALHHCLLLPQTNEFGGQGDTHALYVVESVELYSPDDALHSYPVLILPCSESSYAVSHAGGVHTVTLPVLDQLTDYALADEVECESFLAGVCAGRSAARHAARLAPAPAPGLAVARRAQRLLALTARGDLITRMLDPFDLEEQLYKEIQLKNPALIQEDINSILKERQKVSFTAIMQEILSREATQPIISISREQEPSTQECLETMLSAGAVLRGEYVRRQMRASSALADKLRALADVRAAHRDCLAQLQGEADEVKKQSSLLREQWKLAVKNQDNLKQRCSNVLRLWGDGSASAAERRLLDQLRSVRARLTGLAPRLKQTREHAARARDESKQWKEECKNTVLGTSHSDTVASILQQQTSQISTLIEETKLLKDQLSIV